MFIAIRRKDRERGRKRGRQEAGVFSGFCANPLAKGKQPDRNKEIRKAQCICPPSSISHLDNFSSPRQLNDIMGFYKYPALALLALRAVSVFAAPEVVSQWLLAAVSTGKC
jgi:hypothetical protein